MDCYTASVTVAIKAGIPAGRNVTRRNIRLRIIKPCLVEPLRDLSNIMMGDESPESSIKLPSNIGTSPRTRDDDDDDYQIQRTSSSTRLYLIDDFDSLDLSMTSLDDYGNFPEDINDANNHTPQKERRRESKQEQKEKQDDTVKEDVELVIDTCGSVIC